ncbi:unnamed protein product [Sphagnum troendelagicum]|uniref:Uncharacterized protein n=1 Tax=Sphagnum troendelagicum TaxID=128251 RepID=A0ABP0TG70_9BRYO
MTGGRGKDGELKRWSSRFESATATASSSHAASLDPATKLKFRTSINLLEGHTYDPEGDVVLDQDRELIDEGDAAFVSDSEDESDDDEYHDLESNRLE